MNKAQLIAKIAAEAYITQLAAGRALDALLCAIEETLVSGESMSLKGFGTFSVREREAREGRNPRTGEKMTVDARRIAKFKPSAMLVDRINGEPN
jgi:DNA-binding protein HU-beta